MSDSAFSALPVRIDCGAVSTERQLLELIGASLGFPDYYAPNWDAFDDCIGDMDREDRDPVRLVFENLEHLRVGDAEGCRRSIRFLREASAATEASAGPFRLIVVFDE